MRDKSERSRWASCGLCAMVGGDRELFGVHECLPTLADCLSS